MLFIANARIFLKNADLKGSHSNEEEEEEDVFPYITEIEFHPNGSKTVHISGARVMIMPDGTT